VTGSRQETSGELAAAFATWAGSEPEGVWSAPGRVTLLGEYLDLCGGVVLPTTIDLRARVALRRRPDRLFRVRSRQRQEVVEVETQELEPGVVSGWAAYLLGAIWAMLELGGSAVGMDVMLDSRLPEGAGVSSSAAIECALVEALSTSWKMGLSSWQKAMAARRAEADFVGVPCGLMDQVAAVFGKPACALRFDTTAKTVDYLPLDLRAKGAQLFLLDTNTRRQVGASAYPARRAALERALGELRGASPAGGRQADLRLAGDLSESPLLRHAATEQRRVDEGAQALQRGEFERLGRLMSSSHESLSHDLQVSGPELDLGVQAACAGGAYGAKLTGAGFAGAVVAIGPRWAGPQIRRSVAAAFTARGLRPAVVRAVEPTAGARQDS
jgi:galactokinase